MLDKADIAYFYNQQQMEPEVDISDIINPSEVEEPHFLELRPSKPHPQFVESQSFKKIFYAKRTMRQLLEERTQLCLDLGLSSRNGRSADFDKSQIEHFLGELFKDGPSNLRQFSWTILEDRGTIYNFLASEDKYIPLCKACSRTVYVSIRKTVGRIVCSNPGCKVKLLGQFELGGKATSSHTSHKRQHSIVVEDKSVPAKGIRKSEMLEGRTEEIRLGLQDKELIKKAARRFMG